MNVAIVNSGKYPSEMFSHIMREGSHLNIAVMQQTATTIYQNFTEYNRASLEWLQKLFASLDVNAPAEEFEQYITPNSVAAYRCANGTTLPGYRLGSDSSGMPAWHRSNDSDVVTSEDRCEYVRHGLMAELVQTTVRTLASLTTTQALAMDPDAVRFLPVLADTLIHLDIQNEDDSIPFDKRINPRVDLFGDISRDVLQQRARDANSMLAG